MGSDQSVTVKFPLWPFLNQPLFHPTFRIMLNPRRFQHAYQLRLLERCLHKQSPRINSDNSPRR
jgi:hypothetical protein